MDGCCKNCKFWDGEPDSAGFGMCELSYSSYYDPTNPNTLMFGTGSDGYSGVAKTKAEFGCVQFEEIDQETIEFRELMNEDGPAD